MSQPRVLIATPCRDALSIDYVSGLCGALHDPDTTYIPGIASSPYVGVARMEMVYQARRAGCSEIVFIDADCPFDPTHLQRIRTHDVPIVSGAYCKRKPGPPEWTYHPALQAFPDEDGLLLCTEVPCGFLRVKMEVFEAIERENPDLCFQHPSDPHPKCSFFPIRLWGPGTPEARLEAFLALYADAVTRGATSIPTDAIGALLRASTQPKLRSMVGEDFGFSRLARKAGFGLYVDTKCALRHVGNVGFPAELLPL